MAQQYQRNERALFSAVGDDIVALNVEKGFCYGMENVAAKIWSMLDQPVDVETICRRLIAKFDVAPGTCRQEVDEFIQSLRQEGLVDVLDA